MGGRITGVTPRYQHNSSQRRFFGKRQPGAVSEQSEHEEESLQEQAAGITLVARDRDVARFHDLIRSVNEALSALIVEESSLHALIALSDHQRDAPLDVAEQLSADYNEFLSRLPFAELHECAAVLGIAAEGERESRDQLVQSFRQPPRLFRSKAAAPFLTSLAGSLRARCSRVLALIKRAPEGLSKIARSPSALDDEQRAEQSAGEISAQIKADQLQPIPAQANQSSESARTLLAP